MHICACLYSYNMCDCMRMRLSPLLLGYGFDCRTQTRTHPYTNIVIVIIIGWKWIELHGNGRNELQTTIIWRARMSGIISVVIFCHCYQCWEAALLSKCTVKMTWDNTALFAIWFFMIILCSLLRWPNNFSRMYRWNKFSFIQWITSDVTEIAKIIGYNISAVFW